MSQTTNPAKEYDALAAPFVDSGRFTDTAEVLRAGVEALRREEAGKNFDSYCETAAEEGEASGEAEGDVIGRLRAKFGFPSPLTR